MDKLPCNRPCLREPIPDIYQAAQLLEKAVTSHLAGDFASTTLLIAQTNMRAIREWTESLWGKNSPYLHKRKIPAGPPHLPKDQRVAVRMPDADKRARLLARDGYHCRFCGIPLIPKEVRQAFHKLYKNSSIWGRRNDDQHAAFQAMWLQYDHVLPHSRGGDNSFDNLVITCAPCNFGRMEYTLEELGLLDPRSRDPIRSDWDGLERLSASFIPGTGNL